MLITDEDEEMEDEAEDITSKQDAEDDTDFIEKEVDHEITLLQASRVFSHTLQLVMLKFNEHSFKPLMKKVHALVSKVNKSSKATEVLIARCHKKLVADCPTR